MKKTLAVLAAATLLSLGAAFAQETKPAETKPAAPATEQKAEHKTEKKATTKKHVKKHKKAAKKAETKSEAAPATGTEAPKK